MFSRKYSLSIFVALLAALALAGCAGSGTKDDDPTKQGPTLPAYFEEIPADTFFFVGGSEPVPRELVASTLSKADAMRQLFGEYGTELDDEIDHPAGDVEGRVDFSGGDAAAAEQDAAEDPANWLVEQMGGELDVEGLEELGVSSNPHIAAYAVGTIPVIRVGLADAEKFANFVAEAEAREGISPVELEHRGVKYRRYDNPGEDNAALVRWDDDEVVLAVVPEQFAESFLPYFVGVEKPKQSMADDNTFARVADRHGFESFGAGYLDLESVIAFGAGGHEPSEVTKKFLDPANFEMSDEPGCEQEYMRVSRMMPRLVGGFRHYDDQLTDFAFGAELEESLAQGLAATVSGVPGYESEFAQRSLLEIGFGINMGKMIDFMSERARDIESQPFECPELQEWNEMATNMQRTSGQIPPAMRKLAGFNLLLRNVLLEGKSIDGSFTTLAIPRAVAALRTDDPEALMFLVGQVFPAAGQLNPRPDGHPVPVPQAADAYEGIIDPGLLMTGRGLALSVGPQMTEHAKATLDAEEGVTSPALILRVNLGDPAREFVVDLREIVDQAEGDLDERGLDQEDIEASRRAISVLEDALPEGAWTAAVTSEFSNYGVLFSYRDQGPVLDLSWIDKMDDTSDEDFEALGRVLGADEAADEPVEIEPTHQPKQPANPAPAPSGVRGVQSAPEQ